MFDSLNAGVMSKHKTGEEALPCGNMRSSSKVSVFQDIIPRYKLKKKL